MKKYWLFACLLALCNVTLSAQTERPLKVFHNVVGKSVPNVPPQEVPAGLKTIYTNLGKGNDAYSATNGWLVAGPNSGFQEFGGMPFTPKSDAHVSEVRAGLQWGGGANQVNLSLYVDADGAPGSLLAGPVTVTSLPDFNTCCPLAIADFTPIAVTAGTKYWVVADTPLGGTGSDFFGSWECVAKTGVEWAQDFHGQGWNLTPSDDLFAGAVLGTIP